MRAILTLAIVIAIAITKTGSSTARFSGIRPVVIMIILVDYLIPIQRSNGQEVAWFVLLAAWQLNLCPETIANVPTQTLTGVFHLPQADYLRIGAIDLIPKGMGVVLPSIVHLFTDFVKHLPHI
jgi:hypothetical protein